MSYWPGTNADGARSAPFSTTVVGFVAVTDEPLAVAAIESRSRIGATPALPILHLTTSPTAIGTMTLSASRIVTLKTQPRRRYASTSIAMTELFLYGVNTSASASSMPALDAVASLTPALMAVLLDTLRRDEVPPDTPVLTPVASATPSFEAVASLGSGLGLDDEDDELTLELDELLTLELDELFELDDETLDDDELWEELETLELELLTLLELDSLGELLDETDELD